MSISGVMNPVLPPLFLTRGLQLLPLPCTHVHQVYYHSTSLTNHDEKVIAKNTCQWEFFVVYMCVISEMAHTANPRMRAGDNRKLVFIAECTSNMNNE